MRTLRPDRHWWRSRDGLGVLAGSPGTFLRVTPAGAAVLDAVQEGMPVDNSSLVERLVATGAAHPEPGAPVEPAMVTVVVPVFARTENDIDAVQRLVDSLSPLRCVVVDDASPVLVNVRCHRLVRRDTNGGPGAARNSGVQQVTTEVVAFVDSDVTATAPDILRLTGHLADPQVAFVAPRVCAPEGASTVAQYEALRSPLDMGPRAARVRPGSHVPYVPTAVLVGRTSVVTAGFDEGMRWGEDVEFVWRNLGEGRICLYDPAVVCLHEPRRGVLRMLRQRWNYGRSAAAIDSRIPWSVTPVRSNVFHVLPLALVLGGLTQWVGPALLASVLWTFTALRGMGLSGRDRMAVARLSIVSSSRSLARAATREWWPALAVAGYFFPPASFALLFPLAARVLFAVVRQRPSNQAMFVMLRVADDFVYGAGVWAGALSRLSPRCLLPVLTVRRSARAS